MFYYLCSTIIVLIKFLIPAFLLFLLIPQVLQLSKPLQEAQHFLQIHHVHFLISHLLFYLLLYLLWPQFIQIIINRKNYEVTSDQLKLALRSRWSLLVVLIFTEIIFWWR
ncbi:hypothetical protein ACNVED_05180 [Legionella sp. D16C41]|uniref:hypothetical protein n=1 Tax=Legionella sp. D16C41 TaxID=3402688 RepID=UPI003AF9861A